MVDKLLKLNALDSTGMLKRPPGEEAVDTTFSFGKRPNARVGGTATLVLIRLFPKSVVGTIMLSNLP